MQEAAGRTARKSGERSGVWTPALVFDLYEIPSKLSRLAEFQWLRLQSDDLLSSVEDPMYKRVGAWHGVTSQQIVASVILSVV